MYERQYTRIDTVRQILDEKLNAMEDAGFTRSVLAGLKANEQKK